MASSTEACSDLGDWDSKKGDCKYSFLFMYITVHPFSGVLGATLSNANNNGDENSCIFDLYSFLTCPTNFEYDMLLNDMLNMV